MVAFAYDKFIGRVNNGATRDIRIFRRKQILVFEKKKTKPGTQREQNRAGDLRPAHHLQWISRRGSSGSTRCKPTFFSSKFGAWSEFAVNSQKKSMNFAILEKENMKYARWAEKWVFSGDPAHDQLGLG